jgi:hypothetical protein
LHQSTLSVRPIQATLLPSFCPVRRAPAEPERIIGSDQAGLQCRFVQTDYSACALMTVGCCNPLIYGAGWGRNNRNSLAAWLLGIFVGVAEAGEIPVLIERRRPPEFVCCG